jgi:hypothetical protein
VRGAALVGFWLIMNLGFAIAFPIAIVVFAPFVGVAFFLAHKNGVMRLIGGAVRSQAPTVASLGAHYMGRFLTDRDQDSAVMQAGRRFDGAWRKYLAARREAPWAVRFVLARLTARIPLGDLVHELSQRGVPADRIPEQVISEALKHWAEERLAPPWWPIVLLFAVNVAWFPIITWVIWK